MDSPWNEHLLRRLEGWREAGLARQLAIAEPSGDLARAGVRLRFRGREVLSFACNDYLGLAAHPRVLAAAESALRASGAGSRASPLITGHTQWHDALQRKLAAFKQAQAALVCASGYQAALSVLGALCTENETMLLDRLAHASLIDGAKLSGARVRIFKHNDTDDLERLLRREQPRRCLVAVESLYSMDGDLAPLSAFAQACQRAGALLLVDEAHATGVIGARGRGGLEELCAGGMPPHVAALGTLSKALGSQGGYLCASQPVIDTVLHGGRALMFSTALAPAAAAAATAALALVDKEPWRRSQVADLSEHISGSLRARGLRAPHARVPIIPVIAGDESRASAWSAQLLERGVYVPAIRFPTVRKGQARLRVSVSAAHSAEDAARLLAAFETLEM
jgi:8-amino-7-oxononanoate synthase